MSTGGGIKDARRGGAAGAAPLAAHSGVTAGAAAAAEPIARLAHGGLIDGAARALLIVDLGALRFNYSALRALNAPGDCAGVVKANAYGLGLAPVARALWQEGCQTFFVATLQEGQSLRQILNSATIYILDGLLPGQALPLIKANLRPVLGSIQEAEDWARASTAHGSKLACAIHIDTGMNRLGLSPAEVPELAARADLFAQFELALIMTHLVSGEERGNPLTTRQAKTFNELRALLPDAPASFANSAGTQLGAAAMPVNAPFDLARPGVALYGAHVLSDAPNPMRPTVSLYARVLKVRDIEAGQTIGYNATWRATKNMRVATLAYGYADGLLRALSSTNAAPGNTAPDNAAPGLPVYFGDQPAPLLGRVSMDYIGVDVTALGDTQIERGDIQRGDWAELLGPHVTIDDMAARAGTNAYEILTALGPRTQRHYLGRDDLGRG